MVTRVGDWCGELSGSFVHVQRAVQILCEGLDCNSIQGKTTEFCFRSRVCQPRDEPIALVGHDGLMLMVLC